MQALIFAIVYVMISVGSLQPRPDHTGVTEEYYFLIECFWSEMTCRPEYLLLSVSSPEGPSRTPSDLDGRQTAFSGRWQID